MTRRILTLIILSALLLPMLLWAGCGSDTTPPAISNVTCTDISEATVQITWTTDEESTSQVKYGTTSEYGSISAVYTEPSTSHSVVLEGLQLQTIYHIQVTSTDASGNQAASGDSNFTTLDTTPPVISHVRATVVPGRGADITWTTNEESTSQVEFGTNGDFGSLSTPDTNLVTSHSASLGGLLSDTPYQYRVRSKDASGNEAISDSSIFTSPDTSPPQISGVEAGVIALGTIKIKWTTDEKATTQVEYGTTSNYGSLSPLDDDLETDHSARIAKLEVGATYHYRVKSADASGNIATSEDQTIAVSLPSPQIEATKAQKAQIEAIFSAAETLRGLSPKQPIQYALVTPADFDLIVAGLTVEQDLQTLKEFLVMLDQMSPNEYLYQSSGSESYSGLYDPGTEKLYVVDNDSELSTDERKTLAHECTHALQDQYFDLESLVSKVPDNSDMLLAFRALVEGDASLLEFQYANPGQSKAMLRALAKQEYNTILYQLKKQNVPPLIAEEYMFPYKYGLSFVSSFSNWEAVNQAYSSLPQSTEQILHPEKYLTASLYDAPQTIGEFATLGTALGGSWQKMYEEVMGEFDTRIYLETYLSDSAASKAAAGWDGDRFEYWKDASGKKLIVMSSTWDSTTDVQEFFDAYVSYMGIKALSSWNLIQQDSTTRWWDSAGQSVYLKMDGQDVLILIASDDSVISSALPALS